MVPKILSDSEMLLYIEEARDETRLLPMTGPPLGDCGAGKATFHRPRYSRVNTPDSPSGSGWQQVAASQCLVPTWRQEPVTELGGWPFDVYK